MRPERAEQPRAPRRLNLENQRKQARSLLNAARAGDATALRRLAALRPRATSNSTNVVEPKSWSLHHAQLVIAREQGFKSWAKLKAHIEEGSDALLLARVGAAYTALEMEVAEPLFVDPLARALAGKKGLALRNELRSTTWPPYAAGPPPEVSILIRYFDDALQAAVRELALRQVVLLGAGMDARAFRLRWPSDLVLFEVDDAAVFDVKEPVLRRLRAQPACDRRVVRANLKSAWVPKLEAAGFDPRRPAAFLMSGLQLFDATTVERLFRALSEIACAGSWLSAALVSVDTIESPFMQPFLEKHVALGFPPWRFGVRDPEAFLAQHGWRAACTVLGAPDARYGRWRYGYVPRTVPDRGIPRTYLAVASRAEQTEKAP